MAVRYEVDDLAPKISGPSSPVLTRRLFNAALALTDGAGSTRPYLAEALPELHTDSWRVFQDGRMETTYRLRPGLTWHDGQPLTADDFAFAFAVYTSPGLGIFSPTPQDQMEGIVPLDARTVLIRWRSTYANAGTIDDGDFEPLPRHILQEPFGTYESDPARSDAFVGHRFWTSEYVGLGPYRLERWEPGSHLEGAAFDGHALGRSKIDRVVVRILGDENTVLANVLAGTLHFTTDFTLRFEHALVLKRQWEAAGNGTVLLKRSTPVTLTVQVRPEYVGHPALLLPRVRKALAHSLDRQALNDGIFDGKGFPSESLVPEGVSYFPEIDRAIAKYPYDVRRGEQYMAEAGFARDREGLYSSGGDRFRLDLRVTAGPEFERAQAILTDTWRSAGFDLQPSVLPAAQARDREGRHTFPGLASRGGGVSEGQFTTVEVGSPANRWTGDNRGGWSNPEYDRLWGAFQTTLDLGERTRLVAQMQKALSEELPVYALYFAIQVNTSVSSLRGPEAGAPGTGSLGGGTLAYWNIQDWTLE